MKKILLLGLGLFLLGSCAGGAKVDLLDYQETAKDKQIASHHLPSYVLDGRKPRVAVLPGTNSTSFKSCALAENITEQLTSVLAATKTYDVVERSQLKGLMQEVKFASGLGGGVNARQLQRLAKQLDYAVVVSASGAQAKASFSEASSWTDNEGQSHYTPPTCSMKAKVLTSLRIVAFPSGEIKKVIQQEGIETSSTEVRSTSDCHVQDVCGMLSSATASAMDEIRETLADTAPTYGYVYKIRSHGKDRLASISLGKSTGLEPGSSLDVVVFDEEVDPVKHTKLAVEVVLATCKVTATGLTEKRALCELSGEHVDLVKVKHAVRLRHEKSAFRQMKSGWNALKGMSF